MTVSRVHDSPSQLCSQVLVGGHLFAALSDSFLMVWWLSACQQVGIKVLVPKLERIVEQEFRQRSYRGLQMRTKVGHNLLIRGEYHQYSKFIGARRLLFLVEYKGRKEGENHVKPSEF